MHGLIIAFCVLHFFAYIANSMIARVDAATRVWCAIIRFIIAFQLIANPLANPLANHRKICAFRI